MSTPSTTIRIRDEGTEEILPEFHRNEDGSIKLSEVGMPIYTLDDKGQIKQPYVAARGAWPEGNAVLLRATPRLSDWREMERLRRRSEKLQEDDDAPLNAAQCQIAVYVEGFEGEWLTELVGFTSMPTSMEERLEKAEDVPQAIAGFIALEIDQRSSDPLAGTTDKKTPSDVGSGRKTTRTSRN